MDFREKMKMIEEQTTEEELIKEILDCVDLLYSVKEEGIGARLPERLSPEAGLISVINKQAILLKKKIENRKEKKKNVYARISSPRDEELYILYETCDGIGDVANLGSYSTERALRALYPEAQYLNMFEVVQEEYDMWFKMLKD